MLLAGLSASAPIAITDGSGRVDMHIQGSHVTPELWGGSVTRNDLTAEGFCRPRDRYEAFALDNFSGLLLVLPGHRRS